MSEPCEQPNIDLIEAVDKRVQNVRTRSLDVSFNELADMYENKELIIAPEYQRLFRWSEEQQSRFVESLILELPIPPIFAIEIEDGIYELIDGLQRISSYLNFRGKLREENGSDEVKFLEPLKLTDCDIVKELNGYTYQNLPKSLEIRLKRNFVRMEVLRKESDPRLRYYMFKRLNTGGEILSEQEVRNCTIRLLNDTFNTFLIAMSHNSDFMNCISSVSEEAMMRKYEQELVLRFFAFKNAIEKYVHDVGDFLTEYMESVSDPQTPANFDFEAETRIFEKTFLILNRTLGENAFCKKNNRGNYISRFLAYHYEAVTIGLQSYLDIINPDDHDSLSKVTRALERVKNSDEFKELTTGGGKNYRTPLQQRIKFVNDELGAEFS